jgi:uncharacterized protein YoxC
VTVVGFTWGDLAYLALAVFLFLVGLGLAWVFATLGGTLLRVTTFIRRTEREVLPVITKVGGTVDRVNDQLDKVDQMTDSAVDAVAAIDGAVRTVTRGVTTPVQKLSGAVAGVAHGASSLRTHRSWRAARQAAKDAAARREQDLADEMRGGAQ